IDSFLSPKIIEQWSLRAMQTLQKNITKSLHQKDQHATNDNIVSKTLLLLMVLFLFNPFSHSTIRPLYAQQEGANSGLTLPRMASLRADEVNLRTGPGIRYPINYIYQRRGLPVKVIAEFESWRKISDFENTEGWVHRSMLTSKRTGMITRELSTIRQEPDSNALAVARLGQTMVVSVEQCRNGWCKVKAANHIGWLMEDELWGIRIQQPQ
ncbi:MAG: SH3 domain-containing protein, partial [Pseudomonadota bacterium]